MRLAADEGINDTALMAMTRLSLTWLALQTYI
jgi:hypothetical protein